MSVFTEHNLKKFAPHITTSIMQAFLIHNADDILVEAGITSALILQHFMGQMFVESGGFSTLSENLNYSATRLMQVFGKHRFPSMAIAESYAGNPVKTANYVYGGRMGNVHPGDGWKYRGGGLIQLTGSDNYRAESKKLGIDLWNHPDLIRDPQTALQVAAQFFKACGAVAAASQDDSKEVTRRVNGGHNAAWEREDATNRASHIFTEHPVPSGTRHSSSPEGLLGDFENLPQGEGDGHMVTLGETVGDAPAQIPMTMAQAKHLQTQLKIGNYSPGDINGNINSPSTVGAIAELQKQQGLPVNGVVDDATEDAIQECPSKVVSEDRANETAGSLRAKGSETIAATDNIHLAAHGVSISGVGTLGVGAGSLIAAVNDQADQVTKITDHLPGLSEKIAVYLTGHLEYVGLIVIGAFLIYFALGLYSSNKIVVSERVNKSRTGEDMSH